MELRGRTALVTGAGKRVGRAIAVGLGARGMRVAVHYHGSQAGADESARLIRAAGGQAEPVGADLADPAAPAALIHDVVAQFGALDVLVNSAAVMERTPFGETTVEQWERIFALNLRAPFFLAQAAAPHLARAAGGGAIVNIADLAAFETWPAYLPHGLSKHGVVRLTESLARVLAPAVRVNAVAPGTVLLPDDWSPADAERLRETTPLERHGSPDDVVQAVLYLLDAEFVTGETIVVDGGRRIRR
ncbi:MAG TPA: SDR family oxidoreductase [Gemmatimonadaceae bacterium]|nr:SDR family oxidoreductase [Gemmatimonadaceae bacterium]